MSFSLFPIMAANTLFLTVCNLLPNRVPKIHNQQSLMHRWRSSSRWGSEHLVSSFSYKDGRYFVYDCLQPLALQITQDTPRYTTNNRWRCVDSHSRDGAGRVSQSVLSVQAAKNVFMTVCNLSAVWLPRTQDQTSMTLRQCPFQYII